MLENLRAELMQFMKDIETNLKDKEDILYTRERAEKLIDTVLKTLNDVVDYEEKKFLKVAEKVEQNEQMLDELKRRMDNVYQDIYDEEDQNVVIDCPYCGTEFEADINEYFDEIKCPECQNSIELDWSGNIDDDQETGCSGNCPHCGGCKD